MEMYYYYVQYTKQSIDCHVLWSTIGTNIHRYVYRRPLAHLTRKIIVLLALIQPRGVTIKTLRTDSFISRQESYCFAQKKNTNECDKYKLQTKPRYFRPNNLQLPRYNKRRKKKLPFFFSAQFVTETSFSSPLSKSAPRLFPVSTVTNFVTNRAPSLVPSLCFPLSSIKKCDCILLFFFM